ncbi:MAG: hypothetical protein HZA17_06180 [Nitrospirae bacterium]|nr:hypothetical protein [Nitrospirota bacterium]
MKKLFVIWSVLALLLSATHVFAQMGGMMGEQKGEMRQPGMMMGEGMMPMMQMDMPMMKQMMGQGMMMRDMMQMMMGMMDMQEKMMMGLKPEEKKMMMKNMGQMKEKMKMMSMRAGMMMGPGDPQVNLQCAEQWLKKAIDLHEIHIKDPATATDASQHEMMDQMKKAYGCLTGKGSEIKSAPPKAPAGEEKKKDAHGH